MGHSCILHSCDAFLDKEKSLSWHLHRLWPLVWAFGRLGHLLLFGAQKPKTESGRIKKLLNPNHALAMSRHIFVSHFCAFFHLASGFFDLG
jgi:hypothetical protein